MNDTPRTNQSQEQDEANLEEDEEVLAGSCPVVGIGASAGGLEAFTQFLQSIPPDTGMAFVLVQHLDPQHKSILAEILAGYTTMPLNQTIDDTQVEPNHVYVIPPNTTMEIQQGRLRLKPRGKDHLRHLPIDCFLYSLAEDQKSRSIGVILSGSASDGTLGLRALKSVGGITFAQDETAKFDSMPRNAVAAGAVDFVLPPSAIAQEIARIANHAYLERAAPSALVEDGPVLQEVLSLLRKATSVDFTHYKTPTIKRRLAKRMALHQKNTAGDYLELLKQDPSEMDALFDDLLIGVTEFFRDPEVFEALSATVLPKIVNGRKPGEPIRIWVPGCSSGEEVFSIAICLVEYLERSQQPFPVQLFGTDISERAIEAARAGKYPDSISLSVSPERLGRFFLRLDSGGYQIARSIRELCIFSRQDLTNDPPLSRMDLISCRNLLIYLGSILQRRVLSIFSYALQPNGCLILGHSESLGALADHFIELDHDHKIYTQNLRMEQPGMLFDRARRPASALASVAQPKAQDTVAQLDAEASRLVADDYGPNGFLVDANHQAVRFRGDVGLYVTPPTGSASLDIFRILREDLMPVVKGAFEEAAAKNALVRRESVQVRRNNKPEEINVVVRPITKNGTERHFLVLFEELPRQESREARSTQINESAIADRNLLEELASTRSYLQALIEELRTSNEEAQSVNEELQSTNEELQTAKEELQSSNEELTTTNEEMKSRNSELTQVNNDLLNLLSSMRVPVVMLNKELRIRRFTPLAEKTLNLITTDVGRPITDLKPRIHVPDLEQLISKVIYSVTALDQEVQDQDGHWYSMRINPYRTSENRVEGAVLQLLDIDQLKHTIEAAEHARSYSDAIFETVREPLAVLNRDLRVETANHAFFETFQISSEETLNRSIFEVGQGRWDTPKIHHLLDQVVSSGEISVQDVEVEYTLENAGLRTFQLNARLLERDGGGGQILLALEDVTNRKRAAEAKYRRLFETAKDGILMIDAETGLITDVNAFILDLFGHSREEIVGNKFWEAPPLSGAVEGSQALDRLRREEVLRLPEMAAAAKDGRRIDVEAIGNLYLEGEKSVIQFNIRDITERKELDRKLQQTAKLESLGILAGGVAHDFNNLLTGIMGNASLLLDSAPAVSPDREQLREIVKATQRASDLTRQMLAYSGRGRFVVEAIDVSDLVREISSLVRSSIPRSVGVELNLPSHLAPIEADATQIRQLVMNLVINAAESIPEGKHGFLRVTTGEEQLDAGAVHLEEWAGDLRPGPYISIEVTDSGSGMDEATKAKIFDPFFTTKFTGRGLGLSAALGIVRGHRGSIRVTSAPGRGTTFRLLLPARPTVKVEAAQPVKSEDLRGTGLVLVVDDEETVLRLATPTLKRYGYSVITAPNGEVAVQLVRKHGHELVLVILDLTMPVMSGGEAFAQIRAILPNVPIILSSGYDQGQAEEKLRCPRTGRVYPKPYSIEQLLAIVKATIRKTQ